MVTTHKALGRNDHVLFIMVTFAFWLSHHVYTPILAPYLDSRGASSILVGIILGSYGISQLFLRLPVGIFSDRTQNRKSFIVLGLLASLLSCLGLLFTNELGFALLSRAISGVSASTWVVFTVLYASYFDRSQVTRAMSRIQFTTVTAQLIGMGFSGYLVSLGGWKTPFLAGAVMALTGLILSFRIADVKDDRPRTAIKLKDLPAIVKEPVLLKVSFLSVVAHSTLFITIFGFTPLQAFEIGADERTLVFLVFAFMIPHAVASFTAGSFFVKRLGLWPTLILGFIGSAIFTGTIPFVNSVLALCITQVFNGFALGLTFPLLLSLVLQDIDHAKQASAMGFYQAVYALGIFAGPFVAGWLNRDDHLTNGFLFSAFASMLAAGLSVIWSRSEKSTSSLTSHTAID